MGRGELQVDDLTIHIGLHRTGTTYLQRSVYPRLSGVTYIRSRHLHSWTSRVVWEPGASWNAAERRAEVAALSSGSTLISREALSGAVFSFHSTQQRTAERLAEMFPAARILITIRRQDTYIGSLYKLYVMTGGTSSFETFVGYRDGRFEDGYGHIQIARTGRVSLSMFHLDHLAEIYESLFPGRVSLVPFEIINEGAKPFVAAICGAIGAPMPERVSNKRVNAGYGGRQVAVARWLNPFFQSSIRPYGLLPKELPVVGETSPRRLLQSKWSSKLLGNTPVMDAAMASRILAHYAESNRRLDERYALGLSKWKYY